MNISIGNVITIGSFGSFKRINGIDNIGDAISIGIFGYFYYEEILIDIIVLTLLSEITRSVILESDITRNIIANSIIHICKTKRIQSRIIRIISDNTAITTTIEKESIIKNKSYE